MVVRETACRGGEHEADEREGVGGTEVCGSIMGTVAVVHVDLDVHDGSVGGDF